MFATVMQPFFCCNVFATVFSNLFATFLGNFLQPFCKIAKKYTKSCKQLLKKKVATNLQKVAKKWHKSCKHIEPGTQRTRDTKTCSADEATETLYGLSTWIICLVLSPCRKEPPGARGVAVQADFAALKQLVHVLKSHVQPTAT